MVVFKRLFAQTEELLKTYVELLKARVELAQLV